MEESIVELPGPSDQSISELSSPPKARPIDRNILLARLLVRSLAGPEHLVKSLIPEKSLVLAGEVLSEVPNGIGELMELTADLTPEQTEALLAGFAEGLAVAALTPRGFKLEDPPNELTKFPEAKATSLDYLTKMLALRTGTPPLPAPTPNPTP